MAYAKTTWANGVSPAINAINLNKIETGIYDAHNLLLDRTLLNAAGDIIYAAANDTPARLAIGSARKHLGVNAGATAPEWVDSPQSLMTATGDTLYASSANTPAKLAIGTARKHLGVNAGATAPEWVDSPQSLMTATGDMLYASSANNPAKMAIGSEGYTLTARGGVPTYNRASVDWVMGIGGSVRHSQTTTYNITGTSLVGIANLRFRNGGRFTISFEGKGTVNDNVEIALQQTYWNLMSGASATIYLFDGTAFRNAGSIETWQSFSYDTSYEHYAKVNLESYYYLGRNIAILARKTSDIDSADCQIRNLTISYTETEYKDGFR